MANNRLYLCCIKCLQDPNKELSDCIFFMFKYYPKTGWYINVDDKDNDRKIKWVDDTNTFLDNHKHNNEYDSWKEGMYGEFISIFEGQFDPMAVDKRRISDVIKTGIDKLHNK